MNKKERTIVAVSGGFDPLHIGHIRHFHEAKKLGTHLYVFLQTDKWLKKKKGYVFMPYEERKEILLALRDVDFVIKVIDEDMTVARTLELIHPHIFAKGGDREPENMPKKEIEVCKKLGIKIVYGVGGKKVQSSSWLVDRIRKGSGKVG